jgi:hypothetical protein
MATSRIDGHTHNGNQQSSREVHQEINRIRDEMDHTLNEIGDYLHPKHLLDYVVDSVRSGSAGSSKQTVREYADRGLRSIKQHPGPAILLGGAVLWYLMEQSEDESVQRQSTRGPRRSATYGAWEEEYDWSTSPENEQTWSERAKQALEQVRTTIADASITAKDKVKAVAGHMVGASGKTREEIHAQWANLREHSGSYVDARTGEPYDDSYCEPFCSSSLEACAHISGEKTDDASWSGKAQDVVNSMTSSLQNTGASAKEQLRSLGKHLSGLVSSAGNRAGQLSSSLSSSSRQNMSRGWESASGGMHSAADSARHGVHRVGEAMSHGVSQGRDQFQRAVREQPLAVGAACLGLGLLAGVLAPATKQENELMGEAADRLKDQARDMGEQAVERGKEAASAAAGAVKKEAERQGLTPEKIGEAVRSK